jgi:hypothetical protein
MHGPMFNIDGYSHGKNRILVIVGTRADARTHWDYTDFEFFDHYCPVNSLSFLGNPVGYKNSAEL